MIDDDGYIWLTMAEGEVPLLQGAYLTASETYYIILRKLWNLVKQLSNQWRSVACTSGMLGDRRRSRVLWELPEGLPPQRLTERVRREWSGRKVGAFEERCE